MKKLVAIIPVSLGININTENSAKVKPLNIHLPIFMGIWFALSKKIQTEQYNLEKQAKNNEENIDILKEKREKEEKLWIFSNKEKIDRLARSIQEAEERGIKQTEEMKRMVKTILENSANLIQELNKISYVYINGELSSFSDIIDREENSIESSTDYTYPNFILRF